ncbi:transcriptional regulator family: Fungal Specific TF [Penicillium roqueforti]|nr:transcriptional regulator family: Fungal Specific TF [Penicillium roqueforti]KAI3105935.1 transcriptional regulator family: Fungal Specific TF [Penicillium roqueforti]
METRREGAPLSDTSHTPPTEPPKRVRRWHHRGFTGCSTCRRRHVRCDEASPACNNCVRLGHECDGAQGRMTFKVYGPSQTPTDPPPESSRAPKTQNNDSTSSPESSDAPAVSPLEEREDVGNAVCKAMVAPTTLPHPTKFRFQHPVTSISIAKSIQRIEERYLTYFADQVSTFLIIYNTPHNANPYRTHFPDFARSSPTMANAMQALGALHLANTSVGSQRNRHFQQAMGKYGVVVKGFRARYSDPSQQLGLTDFATCLLLSLFEMMDSQHNNWAVHLKGAREIYNLLFYPQSGDSAREVQRVAETNHPLRPFLVSLLSYLDVAGSCATPGGTVVEGNYWNTMGGGWEYNLGTPSLLSTIPDNPRLVELRQAWSSLMEVQAAISTFASDKKTWMTTDQSDAKYKDIFNQLVVWRVTTPPCLQLPAELDDESLSLYPYPDVLEYAGCIEAYEKATFVHLLQIAGAGRVGWITEWTYMDMLLSRILLLAQKLPQDVGQLAFLWPLFIAGQETRSEPEQKFVRQTMQELKRFGFRNVDKALETLEGVWLKRRSFPGGWIQTLEEVQTNILLP